jgi:hypothetical protein
MSRQSQKFEPKKRRFGTLAVVARRDLNLIAS